MIRVTRSITGRSFQIGPALADLVDAVHARDRRRRRSRRPTTGGRQADDQAEAGPERLAELGQRRLEGVGRAAGADVAQDLRAGCPPSAGRRSTSPTTDSIAMRRREDRQHGVVGQRRGQVGALVVGELPHRLAQRRRSTTAWSGRSASRACQRCRWVCCGGTRAMCPQVPTRARLSPPPLGCVAPTSTVACLAWERVQTFLPYPDFERSARALDAKRLGKQRVECLQVVRGLTVPTYGWRHHPAVKMWRGHLEALGRYTLTCCEVWTEGGRADTCATTVVADLAAAGVARIRSQAELAAAGALPRWLGDPAFHAVPPVVARAQGPRPLRAALPRRPRRPAVRLASCGPVTRGTLVPRTGGVRPVRGPPRVPSLGARRETIAAPRTEGTPCAPCSTSSSPGRGWRSPSCSSSREVS